MLSDAERIGKLENEVLWLTEVVQSLARQSGVQLPPLVPLETAPPDPVLDAIRAGNTIMAIKLWRDRTGVSLAEAKAQVEAMAGRAR